MSFHVSCLKVFGRESPGSYGFDGPTASDSSDSSDSSDLSESSSGLDRAMRFELGPSVGKAEASLEVKFPNSNQLSRTKFTS